MDARVMLLISLPLIGILGLFLRLWYIQVVKSPALIERAEQLGRQRIETPAPRGLIVDRDGTIVAGVKAELVVTAQPRIALRDAKVIQRVAQLIGIPPAELKAKIESEKWRGILPVPVATGVDIVAATKIAESSVDLPGFGVDSQPLRIYPGGAGMSHVLGFVRPPDEKDVERLKAADAKPGMFVGKSGVEYSHELDLMGTPGQDELDAPRKGQDRKISKRSEPTPGSKLVLGIDGRLQQLATELLSGRKGSAIALDPNTGEVLCMVSSPSFNPSMFLDGLTTAESQYLYQNEDRPSFNRATQATYQPGSTFKIVTAIAAALTGKFDPNRPAYCPGFYSFGKGRPLKCLGTHGSITFHRAFEKSCNTYFCDLANRVGVDGLRKACELLHLGPVQGVDLREEGRSIIPTEAWVQKNREGRYYRGNLVQFGIGQDAVSMTPMQMANLVATVANRGIVYKPHVVRAIQQYGQTSADRVSPQVLQRIDLPDTFWDQLQSAALAVVETGTARGSKIPGFQYCGKTGSAEDGRRGLTHSWFVGYAPAVNPKIAIAVAVENAGHGGEVAAPIASRLIKEFCVDGPARRHSALNKVPRTPSTSAALPPRF